MPIFLSSATIRAAVKRLGESGASSAHADFLICKRAQHLAGGPTKRVITGQRSEHFLAAHKEFSLRVPYRYDALGPDRFQVPREDYFVPFGYMRDKTNGYRTHKFPSNGVSDNINRWSNRPDPPYNYVRGTSRPKEYEYVPRSVEQLEHFFFGYQGDDLVQKGITKPTLVDSAVWWYRYTELEERFGEQPTAQDLVDGFAQDFDLTQPELSALFSPDNPFDGPGVAIEFADYVAEPERFLPPRPAAQTAANPVKAAPEPLPFAPPNGVEGLIRYIDAAGFTFESWQVAAFVAAVRTKPFVILAGISGTGKTKLPGLVAEATGAKCKVVAVRPDWTDSSELLGYEKLNGDFVPGSLLKFAAEAQLNPERQHFFVLDEMNIARVEYYLAEVLSQLERRTLQSDGRVASGPLLESAPSIPAGPDLMWSDVRLTDNLTLVGSVNMDETTFGFSRKVLDRAFVIEFSDVTLDRIGDIEPGIQPAQWSAENWRPAALCLADHPSRTDSEVKDIIGHLSVVNEILRPAQLQFGYRVRDEIVMFCLAAAQNLESFRNEQAGPVDPLDLAIAMKVLPRIQGGGSHIRNILERILEWAEPAPGRSDSSDAAGVRQFPMCAARVRMMLDRLNDSGFTSFWF